MRLAPVLAAFACAALPFFALEGASRAAGPDPAALAKLLIQKLDVPETRNLVQAPLGKAKAAQQRAQNARGAGDLPHATELDVLTLTWAEVADDLLKAATAEKKLAELQKAVTDLEQKAVRTQALIEQTIARRGRAEQNLASTPQAERSPKSPPAKPERDSAAPKAKQSAPAGTK